MPDPIRAGDPPKPLPSEVLAGQGVAAFVIRPTDLDNLRTLTTYPPEPTGDGHAACRAIQAGEREAAEQQADALRSEVARLSGLLDDASAEADRADAAEEALRRVAEERDAARREVVALGHQLDSCRAQQARQAATIAGRQNRPGEVVELYRDTDRVPHEPIDLRPVEEDPRRPHPDAWPDDAVLLRYRELRALVALHLDRYADARTGAAMREGDVPLRLAEVLDR